MVIIANNLHENHIDHSISHIYCLLSTHSRVCVLSVYRFFCFFLLDLYLSLSLSYFHTQIVATVETWRSQTHSLAHWHFSGCWKFSATISSSNWNLLLRLSYLSNFVFCGHNIHTHIHTHRHNDLEQYFDTSKTVWSHNCHSKLFEYARKICVLRRERYKLWLPPPLIVYHTAVTIHP